LDFICVAVARVVPTLGNSRLCLPCVWYPPL